MRRLMGIAAVALMMAGGSAYAAGGSCACPAKKGEQKVQAACSEKQQACGKKSDAKCSAGAKRQCGAKKAACSK